MADKASQFDLTVETGADLLRRIYPNGALGGVLLDGLPPLGLELGAPVVVHVQLNRPAPRSFRLRGQLAWVRHKASANLREAFGIDFHDHDATARDRLLQVAHEQLPPEASRSDERFALDLPVQVQLEQAAQVETLCDLSLGGAFIRTRQPPAVGAELELKFRPPLSLRPLRLRGRVVWVRRGDDPHGMGIAFVFDRASEQARLRAYVERLSRRRR